MSFRRRTGRFEPRAFTAAPFGKVRTRLAEALDPSHLPSRAEVLAEMSPEKQAEMRRLYEVRRG